MKSKSFETNLLQFVYFLRSLPGFDAEDEVVNVLFLVLGPYNLWIAFISALASFTS